MTLCPMIRKITRTHLMISARTSTKIGKIIPKVLMVVHANLKSFGFYFGWLVVDSA